MNFLRFFPVDSWTYGAEHEYGDWDTRLGLPEGFYNDRREAKCMNSNGIASSPAYLYGGEVNTPATKSPEGPGQAVANFLAMHPNATVNYRSCMHGHVLIPGLLQNLPALKQLNRYQRRYGPQILATIEPYRACWPSARDYPDPEELKGAVYRWKHRLVSHQTILDRATVDGMSRASTVRDFFLFAKPRGGWQFFKRSAVNLHRMFPETSKDHTTPTIEFRHFPGSLDPEVVAEAARWCRDYLILALSDADPSEKLAQYKKRGLLPMPFPRYDHALELRFKQTCAKDGRTVAQLRSAIHAVFGDLAPGR